MKAGEVSMLTGSLYYRAIICQDGEGEFFLRKLDKNGFWSQREVTREKVGEFLNDNDRMDQRNQ